MPSPSFFSQAGNFISTALGGVDPRTGLFNINLPLANLHSGSLVGPALALSLQYSPLSSLNNGFGRGFSLNLTRYDTTTGRLTLSTGEEYPVSSSGATLRQQKLRNFLFKKTGDNSCQVIHKSGLIEYLSLHGSVYLPVLIAKPDGRSLRLTWGSIYKPARLLKVEDDVGTALCTVSYPDSTVATTTFGLLPDDAEYGYTIVFKFTRALLVRVTSNADITPRRWTFSYDDVGQAKNHRVITGIIPPTGLKEEVAYYSDKGMAFPDIAGLPSLPCVAMHKVYPGGGQPAVLTQWQWTQKNYLGKDAGLNQWQPDIDPMLKILLSDYRYGSTAKRMNADGSTVLSTVTRSYNSYHLQLSEEHLRKGKKYRKAMQYYAKPGATFDEQPAQYALPQQRTESWLTNSNTGPRIRLTWYKFDQWGNPVRVREHDGTITRYVYYPAQGKGNACPADPHGFTRYLRRKKIIPRQVIGDESVTTFTISTWKKLRAITGDGYLVVPNREKVATCGFRTIVKHQYYLNRKDILTYGRDKQRTTIRLPDIKINSKQRFTRTQTFLYGLQKEGLLQSEILTTHDDIKVTRSTLRHPALGHLLSEVDAQAVKITHSYDKLGRVRSRIVAAGTAYERKYTWSYDIETTAPVTIETDPLGNAVKTFFDGAGRVIRQARLDNDRSEKWLEVSSQTYSPSGEVATGLATDWLPGTSGHYQTGITSTYDGWGDISEQAFSDGITKRQVSDPVALTRVLSVKGEANDSTLSTGTLTTEFDAGSLLPVRVTRHDTGGKTMGVRLNEWDGLGRLIGATDERSERTGFSYDGLGREKIRFLPDTSYIAYTYAPHLSGNQVTSIKMTGSNDEGYARTWELGSQVFDGLGRVTKRVIGGRSTEYNYDGASPVPAEVTLPSGKTLRYVYIPELGNVVSRMTADGLTQMFTYSATGQLLSAEESNSKIEYTLTPAGYLKKETFKQDNILRSTAYTQTLTNSLVTYTDINGKATQYERDAYGRIARVTDADLTVSLTYDALGQIIAQTVSDNTGKSSLKIQLAYDAFGREISRTITDNNDAEIKISQTWLANDLMAGRTTQQSGVMIRQEQYSYDSRNRLTIYTVSGNSLPKDAYGHQIKGQEFRYDALSNLTKVTTLLPDGTTDKAAYHYDNAADPTQLTSVEHDHADYPSLITLKYDTDGRMILDEAGRTRIYDAVGRLTGVSGGNTHSVNYSYDALNRLVSQTMNSTDTHQLYYRGNEQVNEVLMPQNKITRLIKSGHTCFGVSDNDGLTLTAGDHHGSLQWSIRRGKTDGQLHAWSPYGNGEAVGLLPGFNGERSDPTTDNYHLGNGYRAYSPVLMRFTCPDSLSPFGAGGINPYAYCGGDPVNLTDPTGHISWQGLLGMVTGVLGLAFSAFTAGTSIAAAGGVIAALGAASTTTLVTGGLGVLADATAITSGSLEDTDPRASSVLGWISMASGLSGMAAGLRGVLHTSQATAPLQFTRVRAMPIESPRVLGVDPVGLLPSRARDPRPLASYTAIDTTSGVHRLNIVAHGRPGRLKIENGNRVDAEGLYQVLHEHGIMDYNFSTIRILACRSADAPPGGISLAQRFAQITGKPVEGYHGRVYTAEALMISAGEHENTFAAGDLAWYINDAFMRGGYFGATEFLHANAYRINVKPHPHYPSDPETFYPA